MGKVIGGDGALHAAMRDPGAGADADRGASSVCSEQKVSAARQRVASCDAMHPTCLHKPGDPGNVLRLVISDACATRDFFFLVFFCPLSDQYLRTLLSCSHCRTVVLQCLLLPDAVLS